VLPPPRSPAASWSSSASSAWSGNSPPSRCWSPAAESVNTRAAFLEVVNGTPSGSLAVIAAATVIALTGWLRADAIASLLIGVLIVPLTVRLPREQSTRSWSLSRVKRVAEIRSVKAGDRPVCQSQRHRLSSRRVSHLPNATLELSLRESFAEFDLV